MLFTTMTKLGAVMATYKIEVEKDGEFTECVFKGNNLDADLLITEARKRFPMLKGKQFKLYSGGGVNCTYKVGGLLVHFSARYGVAV